MTTTCQRRKSKLISINECVNLLVIEQSISEIHELLNARNLLILTSIHLESLSLSLQSSAENKFKKIDFNTDIIKRLI